MKTFHQYLLEQVDGQQVFLDTVKFMQGKGLDPSLIGNAPPGLSAEQAQKYILNKLHTSGQGPDDNSYEYVSHFFRTYDQIPTAAVAPKRSYMDRGRLVQEP